MANGIRAIYIDPPIAIARLGGSAEPQEAFRWERSPDPRANGETAAVPAWTLRVLPNGEVEPYLPVEIRFRDGPEIRPVSPFFEIWVCMGAAGSPPETWTAEPLTPALLERHGTDETAIVLSVDARNAKAARRTGRPDLAFGTFPPVAIRGDHHRPVPLHGTSPPGSSRPMIPFGRPVPLGSMQLMRSRREPGDRPWSRDLRTDTVRFRFTPPPGRFYGPPDAAETSPRRPHPAVPPENAFLDAGAGWSGAAVSAVVQPSDTYDGAEAPGPGQDIGPSLGIVDDTCEAHVEVTVAIPGAPGAFRARATVFVGPPDFGPDRRPFLSLADEINDRSAHAGARSGDLSGPDLDRWVEDLFERVYETASLLNVDWYRTRRAATLPDGNRRSVPLAGDGVPEPDRAMGGRDPLRNPDFTVTGPSVNRPLPLSQHARMRHRALSDVQELRAFVQRHPGRLRELVRRPFEIEWPVDGEDPVAPDVNESPVLTTMRMPPFMRQSNAFPLTLACWQHELLMRWAAEIEGAAEPVVAMRDRPDLLADATSPVAPPGPPGRISPEAERRRAEVLERLEWQREPSA